VAKYAAGLIRQERRHGIEQADVHVLAAPGAAARDEREQQSLKREHAGRQIGDRHAEPTDGRLGPVTLMSPPPPAPPRRIRFVAPRTALTKA
jgi:hypothetical protein